jgi:ABC-2 type transport system permease protein
MNSGVAGAVAATVHAFGAEVETARLVRAGVDPGIAAAAADPLPLTAVTLFNPQAGYATYVLPAAFVLILQQTLLMGIGLLAAWKDEGAGLEREAPVRAAATVLGKALAYLTLQAVLLPLYLISLPHLYGLPRLGDVTTILLFAIPFVLAVSLLGLAVSALMRTPETAQLAFVALGLPLFFLSGASWPTVSIPRPIALVASFVPSTAAIDGFVRITQMGATLVDVRSQFLILWALVFLYGTAAIGLEWSRRPGFPSAQRS